MPFSNNSISLVGERVRITPVYGYGWAMCSKQGIVEEVKTPGPFEFLVTEVLFDDTEARALTGKIDLHVLDVQFCWAALKPRTTLCIDLRDRSVGCSILISKMKPYVSEEFIYPHPGQIATDSDLYVRGFGRASLLPRT